MIILGDKLVPFEPIKKISSVEDIKYSKPNSLIIFEFDESLLQYCFYNSIKYCVLVSSIKQSIYANNLNAKYIVCKRVLAKKVQKIADNYIFDSKILSIIKSSDEIEDIAQDEIDGVIYKELI